MMTPALAKQKHMNEVGRVKQLKRGINWETADTTLPCTCERTIISHWLWKYYQHDTYVKRLISCFNFHNVCDRFHNGFHSCRVCLLPFMIIISSKIGLIFAYKFAVSICFCQRFIPAAPRHTKTTATTTIIMGWIFHLIISDSEDVSNVNSNTGN